MKAIIIGGGDAPSEELIHRYLDENSIIIAADGGANVLYNYGINPDYLLGDFDSIAPHILEKMKTSCPIINFPIDKDYTDSDLALDKAKELGASEVIFLGCTGKRLDHFLGNICVIYRALKMGIKAYIIDQCNVIYLSDKSLTLEGIEGDSFSLLSYFENVKGLTIKGAKYPLENFDLSTSNNLTLSNKFKNKEVEIEFSSGILMIIRAKDKV